MVDEAQARGLAEAGVRDRDVVLGDARELGEGWFFPYRTKLIGSQGVIVNKRTGRLCDLGSAFPIQRDLDLYDRGYQFERYDLVVLAIHDLKQARSSLGRLGLSVTTPSYESGQVWRIARTMTDLEIWSRLEKLPCIFGAVSLYFVAEVLEEVRREGWFTFEALEYRPPKTLDFE